MNTQFGKSVGIALLLAAGLLAALFAMGVFSASGVGAHDGATHSAGQEHDNLGGLTVIGVDADDTNLSPPLSISPSFDENIHEYTVALPVDAVMLTVTADGGTNTNGADSWGDDSTFTAMVGGSEAEVTVTDADSSDPARGMFQVDLTDGIVKKIVVTADDVPATGANNPANITTITLTYPYAANSDATPDAGVIIDLDSLEDVDDDTPQVQLNQQITVALPSFGVPSEIDAENISVTDASGTYEPTSVSVDDSTVTLTMGDTGTTATTAPSTAGDITRIQFFKNAGITNPVYANTSPSGYKITVTDHNDVQAVGYGIVMREVSVSPKSGTRGIEVTITGKGFADGGADVMIGNYTESANSADGVLSVTLATDLKDNDDNNVFMKDENRIDVSDASGKMANDTATFTIKPSFSFSPGDPSPGESVTITLMDIEPDMMASPATGYMAPEVRFAGKMVPGSDVTDADDDKNTTWNVDIPSTVRVGSVQLRVIVTEDSKKVTLNKTITIGTNTLKVSPTTLVPRQQITISGDGFTSADDTTTLEVAENTIASVTIDNKTPEDFTSEPVSSNGSISLTVSVPDTVGTGSRRVEVKDKGGRIGRATVTITKPSISLDPTEGIVGSTVTVTGSGFASNGRVLLDYGTESWGKSLKLGRANSAGDLLMTFNVPSDAKPGTPYTILVKDIDEDTIKANEEHKTPGPVIAVTEEAQVGGTLTITGQYWSGFRSVTEVLVAVRKSP